MTSLAQQNRYDITGIIIDGNQRPKRFIETILLASPFQKIIKKLADYLLTMPAMVFSPFIMVALASVDNSVQTFHVMCEGNIS